MRCVEGFRAASGGLGRVAGEPVGWRGGVRTRRRLWGGARSAFGWFEERSHGVVGASRVVPVGLGEIIEAPFEAHDGDGEVGQAREISRQVAGMNAATVFVIGDVAHVVKSIFESSIGLLLFQSKFPAFQISIQHTETRQ